MRNHAARNVNLHAHEIERQDRRVSTGNRHEILRLRVLLNRLLQNAT